MFPLPSALLLPGGHLPLNIFEPRYLAMVRDCLVQPHRLIGMVQPKMSRRLIGKTSQYPACFQLVVPDGSLIFRKLKITAI
ncbi:MAG: LON peptidase substrate-binding domain-containing protein [Candidatus Puniceispirillaceae bacterium]